MFKKKILVHNSFNIRKTKVMKRCAKTFVDFMLFLICYLNRSFTTFFDAPLLVSVLFLTFAYGLKLIQFLID